MVDSKTIKILAMYTALSATHSGNAKLPEGDNSLKEALKEEVQISNLKRNAPKTYIATKDFLQKKYENTVEDNSLDIKQTRIGPFSGVSFFGANQYVAYLSNSSPKEPIIVRSVRELSENSDHNYDSLAECYGDTINMPEWKLSPKYQKAMEQIDGKDAAVILGNPLGELLVYRHEATHFQHYKNNQIYNKENQGEIIPAEFRISTSCGTEKIAYIQEYLQSANIWKKCHEQGKMTLDYNGKKINVDQILDWYPGLRDVVEKDNFKINSPEYQEKIIQLASHTWDRNVFPTYMDNISSSVYTETGSIMDKIRIARDTNKIKKDMLKNINIGDGIFVDIPEKYVSSIFPSSEKIHKLIIYGEDIYSSQPISPEQKSLYASIEGLLNVDQYLNTLNLTDDIDKENYLKDQYGKIINRDPKADKNLKQLLLDCQISNSKKTIIYSDGLINCNGIVSTANKNISFVDTPLDKALDHYNNQKEYVKPSQSKFSFNSVIQSLKQQNR